MAPLELATPRDAARPTLRAPGRGAGAAAWTTWLFTAAVAVIALHVADDSFLQPPAGTTAADHLLSGLVPLLLLGAAAWAYPRLRGLAQGALSAALGCSASPAGSRRSTTRRRSGRRATTSPACSPCRPACCSSPSRP